MVFERCLNDWFGFAEFHLEAAGLHAFPPEVGQRGEAGTIQVMHAKCQLQLREIQREPAFVAGFQEGDEGHVFLQPLPFTRGIQGKG